MAMNNLRRIALVFFLSALAGTGAQAQSLEETLSHLRNLGKAFYENSATQYEAVGQFKKALDLAPSSVRERINYGLSLMRAGQVIEGVAELEKAQRQDPSIPHTWFNLGIAYKRDSRYEEAIHQFERMIELVPDAAISHYNLGVLYKLEGRQEKVIWHFQRSAELDPNLAAPHFQLATAYRQTRRQKDFKREMHIFLRIKKKQAHDVVPKDLEWSFYSEIYETIDPAATRDTGPAANIALNRVALEHRVDATGAGLSVLDVDADGQAVLMVWSKKGVKIFKQGQAAVANGLEGVKNIVAMAAGDIDNDGLVDLCVVTRDGADLYVNNAGRFQKHTTSLPTGRFNQAVWLDYDHDYDIDLFLLGSRSVLMRNNGSAGFGDQTDNFPFVDGRALNGTRLDLIADMQGMDLAVVYADRPGVLYRDRLAGEYEAQPVDKLPGGVTAIEAVDFNNDGWTDLAAGNASGVALLVNDHREGFRRLQAPGDAQSPLVFADLENRSVSELIAGGKIYRNLGGDEFASGTAIMPRPAVMVCADFDVDGRLDLAVIGDEGELEVWHNETVSNNHWLRVALQGVKNLKLAPGAEIEIKAGIRYQKKIYQGSPLLFGLASYEQVDAVRITWPNGLIQNETRQATGQSVRYKEAQRLSGSCPMVFTWNGEAFDFITDVLGVAPLGASAGDGRYFPVDHDEYIQITGESLVPDTDGRYEIRITEELREVAYLDEIRLIAVDHHREVEIFTNDKFKGPPFPEFRLVGVGQRTYPIRAHDHRGRDVLQEILARDRTYPDNFARNYAGVAEKHAITFDFGKKARSDRAILVLNGWVDWADGSTFLGISQQTQEGLILPYLQVKDPGGNWKTVIEDMGIPAGKPKTIVVDLTDKFLSDAREIRVLTNLCVYWDEIFLSTDFAALQRDEVSAIMRMTDLHATSAELRFRGFSRAVIHPERKQPERFIYGEKRFLSMWNPTRGMYTRYGDVRELVETIDDRFVIMGSGDEIRLLFDAVQLPLLTPGWRRDYLLFVDGWTKDGDANTAFSQTVEPLPYHGMPGYPYVRPHGYPQDGAHTLYREFYNTRPALCLIRPFNEKAERSLAARGAGTK